jgi:hypothetical protein
MLRNLTNKISNKNLSINSLLKNSITNNFILNKKQSFNYFTTNKKNPFSESSTVSLSLSYISNYKNKNFSTIKNNKNNLNYITKKNFLRKIFKKKEKKIIILDESEIIRHPNLDVGGDFYGELIQKLQINKKYKESEKKNLLEKLKNFNEYLLNKNNEISNKHYLDTFDEIKKSTINKYKNPEEEQKRIESYEELRYSNKIFIIIFFIKFFFIR